MTPATGDPFDLDVSPDSLLDAANRVRRVGAALERRGESISAMPGRVGDGWTGKGAEKVLKEMQTLGTKVSDSTTHFENTEQALRRLARQYREALDALPGLNSRWQQASDDHADAVSRAVRAHRQTAEGLTEGDEDARKSANTTKDRATDVADGALERRQSSIQRDFEDLREQVRQQTRTAARAIELAAMVTLIPAPDFWTHPVEVQNSHLELQDQVATRDWTDLVTLHSAYGLESVYDVFEELDYDRPLPPAEWHTDLALYPGITIPEDYEYDPIRAAEMVAQLDEFLLRNVRLTTVERTARVNQWARFLSPEDLLTLTLADPSRVGNLGGIPEDYRYGANRLTLLREKEKFEQDIADLSKLTDSTSKDWPTDGFSLEALDAAYGRAEIAKDRLRMIEKFLRTEGLAYEARRMTVTDPPQVLVYEPAEFEPDGTTLIRETKVAVAFGDLDRARYVSTVVGGMTTSFTTFTTQMDRAAALRYDGGETAAIAWMEHEPPPVGLDWDMLDAISLDKAEEGADELIRFTDELVLREGAQKFTFGHSYGGTTLARALAKGLDVDVAIFLGAPGPGRDIETATQLQADNVTLYAASAPGDHVSGLHPHGKDLTTMVGVTHLKTSWGGRPISGHTSYYAGGTDSHLNLLSIANGKEPVAYAPNVAPVAPVAPVVPRPATPQPSYSQPTPHPAPQHQP